jgi:alpha-N-arabinofuranosidase
MQQYANPVIPGFFPDPSICKRGESYYLVNSSFEYFPAVPLFHSTDLVNWKFIRYILDRPEQVNLTSVPSSCGIFAPSIRYYNNCFYMITTNVAGDGHFYVTTHDPNASWSDPIFVEGPGFDPDLFFDTDGNVYFIREDITSYGIHLFKIDISTGKLLSDDIMIYPGHEDPLCEAPHLYKIGEWYYLLTAEGGTYRGHMITVSRSRSIFGPYESCPYNPILTHRHLVMHPLQSLGHGDLVQGPDNQWYLVFLGTRPVGKYHYLGRETFLAPAAITSDGWFSINNGEPITQNMTLSYSCQEQIIDTSLIEMFDSENLGWQFNVRRNPKSGAYIHNKEKQVLEIKNLQRNDDIEPFSFMGIRLRDHSSICETVMSLDFEEGAFGGIMCIMNEMHYYSFGPRIKDGNICLCLKHVIGSMVVEKTYSLEGNGEFRLYVEINPKTIKFYLDGHKDMLVDSQYTYLLSSEVAGGFTGVFVGMFNASTMQETKAYFSQFSYCPDKRVNTSILG